MCGIKVYLDDDFRYLYERDGTKWREPPGIDWIHVARPEHAIALLKTGQVTDLSLDHDLRLADVNGHEPTGMTVLVWLEEQCFHGLFQYQLPNIRLHTQNWERRPQMEIAITNIKRYWTMHQ